MPTTVPQEEKPILLKLLNLRMRLSVLKRDRTTHLDINQLEPLRQETAELIQALIDVRHGVLLDDQQKANRCDDLLDEVCQMISLCFLSLGKTRESPAVYSQVASISHCFERLDEFGIYAEEFLEPYANMLKDIKNVLIIDEKNETLTKPVMQILWHKFRQCENIYKKLLDTIHEVSPELLPIRNQLLRIRRQLLTVACKSDFHSKDITPLQEELNDIDAKRVDGKFLGKDGSTPAGQAVVTGLLDQVHQFAYDLVIVTTDDFSPALQTLRERLVEIKNHLERLALTQKWTMRQTDLFTYQHQLHDIVKLRYTGQKHSDDDDDTNTDPMADEVDQDKIGKFLDAEGDAPPGQTVVNFLLHKCYRMIMELLNDSVPVGEALTPIYNQLTSVKQCLMAVKKTGAPCTPEELYPYQMKLASIENLRKDGKFLDARGDIPEGQALCVNTLEECYQLMEELGQLDDDNGDDDSA
ncbi:hypothetical protein BC941DRAFT_454333 [Chlamydoabsidia padenii]|nr:hypothetical protein BC941DRAFT_454333 [Chlamydoabsidia padenii]